MDSLSSKTTINTLSAELLADIFLYLHDVIPTWSIKPPIVGQVCQWWRHVTFLAKELWCTIPIRCDQDGGGRILLAEVYAERGGDHPLTLLLGYRHNNTVLPTERVKKLVQAHAKRVRSLYLWVGPRMYHNFDWLGMSGTGQGEGFQAWSSLEFCQFRVEWPMDSLSFPIWPNPSYFIPFPSRVSAPNLRKFHAGGGIFPFNFDLDKNKIRHLVIDFDEAENAQGYSRANTVAPRIFETFPNLQTFEARLSPTMSAVRYDSPFSFTLPWSSHQGVGQYTTLRALHLTSGSQSELEWIPPLPRLQRLQLGFQHEKEFSSPSRRATITSLLSFLRRVGGDVEFLSLNIPALSMGNPEIWHDILSLTPKVRSLSLSEVREEHNLERLLNVEETQPPLVPFLHTLRWYHDEDAYSHYYTKYGWSIDPLLEMVRSRGWLVDDHQVLSGSKNDKTYLTSVFVPKPYEETLVQPGCEARFEEKRVQLRRWNSELTLEWDEQFYGTYVARAWEPIGGALYQSGRGWARDIE